jgi:hypothetical protein
VHPRFKEDIVGRLESRAKRSSNVLYMRAPHTGERHTFAKTLLKYILYTTIQNALLTIHFL